MVRQVKNDLLFDVAISQTSRNGTATRNPGEEISIRGKAGPYVVVGSNFAPGTTAADIESAMMPSGGEMQSCRILTSTPTVIAEMVFGEKHNAESVISTFNNKKVGLFLQSLQCYTKSNLQADGRILHVYMKEGGPSPGNDSASVRRETVTPKENRIDLTPNETMSSHNSRREQSDRQRRANPEFQDGSYGFGTKEDEMDVDTEVLGTENASTHDLRPKYSQPNDNPRDNRDHNYRDDRRSIGYSGPRDSGRGRSYYDRAGGRPRDDYRLHSDDLYPRPRGRGFR